VWDSISTQPDLLATVLDLTGLDLQYPIMGKSIFSDKKSQLSLMQFNDYYALRVKDEVAILRPNKKPLTFIYENEHLKKAKHNKNLEDGVVAFVNLLNYLYENRLYR
jgi:hypothetical protein